MSSGAAGLGSVVRRRLTLRTTFVIAFAAIAVVVAGLVGLLGYSIAENGLRGEVERSLSSAATTLSAGGTVATVNAADPGSDDGDDNPRGRPARPNEGIIQAAQTVAADGTVTVLVGPTFPIGRDAAALATAAAGTAEFSTITIDGRPYRMMSLALGDERGIIQVARDLTETENVLDEIAWNTVWVALVVLLVAGGVGLLIARRLTRRLSSLTAAAERVSATGFLDVEITAGGHDEVTRLAGAMQSMLAELARSRDDQRRLVQDAGHELRTPLTSLRTNISVLRRFDELSPRSRGRLLDDVEGESRELTDLVNELVELASDRREVESWESVDLAALAEGVAGLFRRRSGRAIEVTAAPDSVVVGQAHSIERAISNLIDNALKFDPEGAAPIEISVTGDGVTVADRGPGIAAEDVRRVFDRFFRSPEARSLPGSGLGLSIVQEVAVAHGGAATATHRAGGGTVIGFTLGDRGASPQSDPDPAND